MNFSVSRCRMMTSEMVKACVNSDRFYLLVPHFHQKNIAFCLCIYIIFSSSPCVSVCSNNSQLKGLQASPHPLKCPFYDWIKRCPRMGFLLRASILLRPGTLRRQQPHFGPCQTPPEASVRPFISKEKRTEKIPSKRPANSSGHRQKKRSLPRVQWSLVAHLR